MPAKKEPKINLLPQEEFEASTLGRVLNWTLSSFRIIVILTEMVVMLAFLSRFWLDARLTDLNDVIKQKQAVISAQSDFENKFRLLQKKVGIFAAFQKTNQNGSVILSNISSFLPSDISLSTFNQQGSDIEITGTSSSERSIAQLISNLESDSSFNNVSLSSAGVNPDDQSLLVFTIKMSIQKKEGGS